MEEKLQLAVFIDFDNIEIGVKTTTSTELDLSLVLEALKARYAKARWVWVQEEPLNMGAASFLQANLKAFPFGVVSRKASASTATGFAKLHAKEQAELIATAFNV